MRDADGRLRAVDVLATRARRAIRVDAQVRRIDGDIDVPSLRQHGDSRRRRVDAAARLRHRHALDAVRAALVLEIRIRAGARDHEGDFLEAADLRRICVHELDLPALLLRIVRVHAEEVARKERRLFAADAAAYLDDDILLIIRVLRQEEDRQLFVELLLLLHEVRELSFDKGMHLMVKRFAEHRLGLLDALDDFLIAPEFRDDRRQRGVFLRVRLPLRHVGHDLRVADQRLEFPVFIFNGLELLQHRFHLSTVMYPMPAA